MTDWLGGPLPSVSSHAAVNATRSFRLGRRRGQSSLRGGSQQNVRPANGRLREAMQKNKSISITSLTVHLITLNDRDPENNYLPGTPLPLSGRMMGTDW